MKMSMACNDGDILDVLVSDDEFEDVASKTAACSDHDVEMAEPDCNVPARQNNVDCDKKPAKERLTFPGPNVEIKEADNCDETKEEDNDCEATAVDASADDRPSVVGAAIARKLKERKFHLITKVVEVLGFDIALEMLQVTKRIEKKGGLKTSDGKRRRTTGGVYLYIMKDHGYATPEQIAEIYKVDKELMKDAVKAKKKRQQQRRKAKIEALKKELLPQKEET